MVRTWAILAALVVAVAFTACGGGESGQSADETAAGGATTTSPDVTPGEVVEDVIAALVTSGAQPDEEAAARVVDEGGTDLDASKRLRLPEGGSSCRIRDIAAGIGSSRIRIVADFWAPFAVRSDDGEVALRLDPPNDDPGSPQNVRCAAAAAAALGNAPVDDGGPDEMPEVAVATAGVRTAPGVSDLPTAYYGAVLENPGRDGLADVQVGFDLLDAQGRLIGSGPPLFQPVTAVPAGGEVAVAGQASELDCSCDPRAVAEVRPRVESARVGSDPAAEARVVARDAVISETTSAPEVRVTLVNSSADEQRPNAGPLWRVHLVFVDARGSALAGTVETLRPGEPIPAGGRLAARGTITEGAAAIVRSSSPAEVRVSVLG